MIGELGAVFSSLAQRGRRRGRSMGALEGAYQPLQRQASAQAQGAAMQQGLNVARSGGTAGGQASALRAAQQMAPAAASQAELAGHQVGGGYASLADQYQKTQFGEDQYQNEITWGSLGQGMVGLGGMVGALSDKRAKQLESENAALSQQNQALSAQLGGGYAGGIPAAQMDDAQFAAPDIAPIAQQNKERELAAQQARDFAADSGGMDARVRARAEEMTGDLADYGTKTGNTLRAIFGDSGAIARMQDQGRAERRGEAYQENLATARQAEMARADELRREALPSREELARQRAILGDLREAGREEMRAQTVASPGEARSFSDWLASKAEAAPAPAEEAPSKKKKARKRRPAPAKAPPQAAPSKEAPSNASYDPREGGVAMSGSLGGLRAVGDEALAMASRRGPAPEDKRLSGYGVTPDFLRQISDERAKDVKGDGRASEVFRNTPGYAYSYKDEFEGEPGAPPGQHYGIMAQDLEKSEMGQTVVGEDETGMKRVDTERLSMLNSAGINEILQRLDKMEGKRARR